MDSDLVFCWGNINMLAYCIIFIIALFFVRMAENSYNKADKRNRVLVFLFISIVILLLSLFAGFRNIEIGTDTKVYLNGYFNAAKLINSWNDLSLIDSDEVKDMGFFAYCVIITSISHQDWFALFSFELLILGVMYYALFKLSRLYSFSICVFSYLYLMVSYNYSLNIVRQACAMSFILLAFYYLQEKKWLKFAIISIIAVSFHTVSIIAFLIFAFYYLSKMEFKNTKKMILILLLLSFFVITNYQYLLMIVVQSGLISPYYIMSYADASSNAATRMSNTDIVLLLTIFMTLYFAKKKEILNKNCFVFALLCTIAYGTFYLFAFFNQHMFRIALPFYLMSIFFVSIVLSSKNLPLLYKGLLYFVFTFSWYYLYIICNNGETYPYKSDILGI